MMGKQSSNLSEQAIADLIEKLCEKGYLNAIVTDSMVLTGTDLRLLVQREITASRGRLTIDDAALILDVSSQTIQRIVENMTKGKDADPGLYFVSGHDIISSEYMDLVAQEIDDILKENGRTTIFDLSQRFELPVSFLFDNIQDRIGVSIHASIRRETELVTSAFEESQRFEIRKIVAAVKEPTAIKEFLDRSPHEWDATFACEYIEYMCDKGSDASSKFQGELKGTGMKAVYVPSTYANSQRNEVDEFYQLNGYITKHQAGIKGVTRMDVFVRECFPNAVSLPNAMVNPDIVLAPLEAVFLEAIESRSYADLTLNMPEQLFELGDEDISCVVFDHIIPRANRTDLAEAKLSGILLTKQGIWFSQSMIDDFTKKHLSCLIESFAIEQGEILFKRECEHGSAPVTPADDDIEHNNSSMKKKLTTKEKRRLKAKKSSEPSSKKKKSKPHTLSRAFGDENINGDFMSLLRTKFEEIWSEFEGETDVLDVFSHQYAYKISLADLLHESITKHIKILRSKYADSSMSKEQLVRRKLLCEQRFEDLACFPTACMLIQVFEKFVRSLPEDHKDRPYFEQQFLHKAASFVKGLTEYCLTQHDLPGVKFMFTPNDNSMEEESSNGSIPNCCSPAELSEVAFVPIFLICQSSNDDGTIRSINPLDQLRKGFPGNIGVFLSRLWILCGGEYYAGGKDHNIGDVKGFLSFAEENCLAICGLPFKKLDKKSEKQLMFHRRRALKEKLEESNDAMDILQFTMHILIQQVKSLAAIGSSKELFDILREKLPKLVEQQIADLATAVDKDTSDTDYTDLMKAVKECGLCKDISKHELLLASKV